MGARNAVPAVGPPPPQPPPRPHVTGRFSITLVQKYHDKPAFAGLSNSELIGKILEALQAADVWLEERPHRPNSEGNIALERTSPFIRAVGWHRSRDIWVTVGTEAGCTTLIEAIDKWLPILSDWLLYSHKTYPVMVHRIPTTFNTSWDSTDVCEHLVDYNWTSLHTYPPS